jgi:hypothetical protein
MPLLVRALAVVSILLAFATATGAAMAQTPGLPLAPREGVVLLRNGHVLRGMVTHTGDQYTVTVAGGEIRLKDDAVELVCADLEEGYRRKHDDIQQGKVQDRLDLAQWCIRHELLGYAARELSDAIAADPKHPRIALVERQLKLARERPAPAVGSAAALDASPSNDDLDRLMRGLPRGTAETFANTIQPLLLNTCTAAGCHGPQSENGLRLLRIPLGKTPSRRLTQRNLYAVLATIDHDDPPASRLLTAPIAPHGTAKAAIFTNREVAQYKHLVDWVQHVASKTPPPQPASVDRPAENLLQNMPSPASVTLHQGQGAALPQRASAAAGDKRAELPRAPSGAAAERPKGGGNRSGESPPAPIDEFDPDVFNRQFAAPK